MKNNIKNNQWKLIARPNQLPPQGDWNIWLILAGRGFGKTRSAAETIREWAIQKKFKRIALIANMIQEAKQVMVEGESGLLAISPPKDGLEYFSSKRLLKWKNGAIATLYGAEDYEQLRGPQFDAAWVDEFAKFMRPKETFEQLSFALRLSQHPRMILTTTPRPIPFIKEIMKRDDVVTVRGTSWDNKENLSPTFRKQLEFLKGSRLEAQEIYGEIVEEAQNTLWSWQDIEQCYRNAPHFLKEIVIGVDPALTDHGDETGIIVAGLDGYNKAYVIEDLSMSGPPQAWCEKIVKAYHQYRAKKIVIETNAGGDLLVNLLKSADNSMQIKKVYARKSKTERAEPIVILYQKNMVFHTKQFQKLEMQMATYMPGEKSPDRMDAMVWAMTELFGVSDCSTFSTFSIDEVNESMAENPNLIPITNDVFSLNDLADVV